MWNSDFLPNLYLIGYRLLFQIWVDQYQQPQTEIFQQLNHLRFDFPLLLFYHVLL